LPQDLSRADTDYINRLTRLIQFSPRRLKHALLAFDKHYTENGEVDQERTEFFTPNEYVWKLAQDFPSHFYPTMSVHPYKKGALEEMEYWAKKVARSLLSLSVLLFPFIDSKIAFSSF
jgi:hypothetical protein